MPWKLADEPTVRIELRLPASMKEWLESQPESASAILRKLISSERAKRARAAEIKALLEP